MRSRTARRLIIALVVLILLLLAADRIGNYVAERTAASTLQSSQHLQKRPSVDIGGFPFLTQLISRSFGEVTVTADDVPVGSADHPLDISTMRVVLHNLTVSRDFSQVQAQTATGTARIGYPQLSSALGVQVGYAGDGRIRASKQLTVAGTTVHATITSRPALAGHALEFAGTEVQGAGQLADALSTTLSRVFAVTLPLSRIPFQIQVTDLQVSSNGLVIGLLGHDLRYSR